MRIYRTQMLLSLQKLHGHRDYYNLLYYAGQKAYTGLYMQAIQVIQTIATKLVIRATQVQRMSRHYSGHIVYKVIVATKFM